MSNGNEIDNNDIFSIVLAEDYTSQHYDNKNHCNGNDDNDSCFISKSSTGEYDGAIKIDNNTNNDRFDVILTNYMKLKVMMMIV